MVSFFLPDLIVPDTKEEIQDWANKILQYTSFASGYQYNFKNIRRYNYRNGTINPSEFEHITKLYCLNEKDNTVLPAFIRQINPIDAMVLRQIGNALSQPFTFTTKVNDEESIRSKYEEHIDNSKERVLRMLRQQMQLHKQIGQPLHEGDEIPEDPQEIAGLNFDKAKTKWEEIYQTLIDLVISLPDIQFRYKFFHDALESLIVTNCLAFEVYNDPQLKMPNFRVIDQRDLWTVPSSKSPYIEDSIIAAEIKWQTIEEIISETPELTLEQIEELKKLRSMYFANSLSTYYVNNQNRFGFTNYDSWFDNYYQGNLSARIFKIKVARTWWRASAKKKYLIKEDSLFEGETIKIKVDEKKAKAAKDKGEKIESSYYEAIWYGKSFGGTMWSSAMPILYGQTQKDNPFRKKIPLCGIINNRPSFVDGLIDLQNLRIQLWYSLERLFNQISGNILVIDEAAGGSVVENLYNLAAYRILKINTAQEGGQINPNVANNITTKDMSLGNSIQQLLLAMNYIDQQIAYISGQNDAATGQMKDYASNGLAQQQLAQAQLVNMPRLDDFYTCGQHLLQMICEGIPKSFKGKSVMRHYLSYDSQMKFANLTLPENEKDFPNLSVNVLYSASDVILKNQLIGMANQKLATSTDPILDNAIFKMQLASTAKEAQKIYSDAVDRVLEDKAKQQAIDQQQMQIQLQAQQQTKLAVPQIQADAVKYKADKTSQTELQKQHMKGMQEGMMQDAAKTDSIDQMMAQKELEQQPTQ
jgi:hypothetical protein